MDTVDQLVRGVEPGLRQILALLVQWIGAIEIFARAQLVALHVAPGLQSTILLIILALLLALTFRVFAGLLKLLVALLLILLAVQVVMPLARFFHSA